MSAKTVRRSDLVVRDVFMTHFVRLILLSTFWSRWSREVDSSAHCFFLLFIESGLYIIDTLEAVLLTNIAFSLSTLLNVDLFQCTVGFGLVLMLSFISSRHPRHFNLDPCRSLQHSDPGRSWALTLLHSNNDTQRSILVDSELELYYESLVILFLYAIPMHSYIT